MTDKYLIFATIDGSKKQIDFAESREDADILQELHKDNLGIKVIVSIELNPEYGKEESK